MPSRVDQTMTDLAVAGYATGSIQDRQYAYLKDLSGLVNKSSADMQIALGHPVSDLLISSTPGGGGGGPEWVTGVLQAPTYSTITTSTPTGTSFTIAVPAGLQVNDHILVLWRSQSSDSTVDFTNAAFTNFGAPFIAASVGARVTGRALRLVKNPGAEPANYTFTTNGTSSRIAAMAVIVRNLDTNDPIMGYCDLYSGPVGGATTATSNHPYTVDLSDGFSGHIFQGSTEVPTPNSSVVTVPPSEPMYGNFSLLARAMNGVEATQSRTVLDVYQTQEPYSPQSADSITWAGPTLSSQAGYSFSLRPSSPGYEGTAGFANIDAMWAKGGATWAHRGGSFSYPEMCEYSYRKAVRRNYHVLEFSAQKTLDGVWVGVHDLTLDRTSQIATGVNVTTITYAQLQAYNVSLKATRDPQPYWRLDAFLQKYGKSHIVVIDPKNGFNTPNTFFDLADQYTTKDRCIMKFTGVGSGSVAFCNAAKARGYKTWGYFYQTDFVSGDFETWQGPWDYLGLEIAAPQTTWDAVLAKGKKTVGHIAQTQADYNSAIAKGAHAVQTSGAGVITGVGMILG